MILLIIVFGAYFLLLLLLMVGWQRALTQRVQTVDHPVSFKITVVIPFRNEAQNIAGIILDLKHQNYNHDLMEVLLSNDHSTDTSAEVVNNAIVGYGNFKVIHSPLEGKKQAIAYAVEQATGEIIVTTDADCRIPENWLVHINNSFQDSKVKMVFGGVKIKEDNTFFSGLQAMEFASLIGSGAAALNLGFPTMCNGANLAFRKSVFFEVEGYEGNWQIPSGDDEFLMRKIDKKFPGSIRFMNTPDSVVSTQSQNSVKEFIHQRLRWAGKWKHNSSGASISLAIFVVTFQISFLSLVILIFSSHRFLLIGFSLVGVKLTLESIFLFQVGSFLQLRWKWFNFLVLQIIFPVYVVCIGLTANFGSYIWKGRKLSHSHA